MTTRIKSVERSFEDLKKRFPTMTDFECLKIAIENQRNEILAIGLTVSFSDQHPSAIEAIAMALGFTHRTQTNKI